MDGSYRALTLALAVFFCGDWDDVNEPDPSVEPLLDADECGDKVADLPLRQSDAHSLHDETHRDLTAPAIRFTNHRGVFNLRMLDEDGLELDRRHLMVPAWS
ncbi:hypothetical protein GEV33_003592 [Tenebrio molitor]|uniref:Uncharacterized protein n=1 Tax=Tenebrio molitor TaxID=7067 RepID=A0A8J6HR60_TENMO|nr:hypothetical protein GEV33_003592 [Tenebrio molitor]